VASTRHFTCLILGSPHSLYAVHKDMKTYSCRINDDVVSQQHRPKILAVDFESQVRNRNLHLSTPWSIPVEKAFRVRLFWPVDDTCAGRKIRVDYFCKDTWRNADSRK